MLAAFLPTLNISYSVGLQQLFSDESYQYPGFSPSSGVQIKLF
jgi:hypothetical protein